MKSNAERQIAASQKRLKEVQKEQDANHTFSHRLDTHSMTNKGGGAPLKVVGGKANPSSHQTEYQKKMARNETETRGTATKQRTLLQKAIAKEPRLFDGVDSQFKPHTPFNKRSALGKDAGTRLMGLTLSQNGDPLAQVQADQHEHQMTDFNQRKLDESTQHGAKPSTTVVKTREHFKPKQGR